MQRARFCFAESGFGLVDLRCAFAFWRRSYWRLERVFDAGSGEVGRRRRGRCFTRVLTIADVVSGECARDSSSSATLLLGVEAILSWLSHVCSCNAGEEVQGFR